MHRTGTTSIHRTLLRSKEVLKKNGVLYPDLGVDCRHVRIAWNLKSGKVLIRNVIQKIKSECDESTKLVVLSSEDFCLLNIKRFLSKFSEHFDVSCSIYLKRQDLWLESWYNQNIKWPWNKKFSSCDPDFFIKNYKDFFWLDYNKLLSDICSVVSIRDVYVNTVEKGSVANTSSDLIGFLGLGEYVDNKFEDKNASLSYCQIQVLKQIDLIDLPSKARRKIIKSVSNIDIEEDDGSRHVFSEVEAKKVLDKFDKSNIKVAQKFFNRDDLFIDSVVLKKNPIVLRQEDVLNKYIPSLVKDLSLQKID